MLEFPNLQKLCATHVQFCWNRGLEDELKAMMRDIKSHIKLSPLDVNKDVVVWTDAAPAIGIYFWPMEESR